MVRAERIGPDRLGQLGLEDGDEAGDAALDDLLEDDVGRVEAGLRPGVVATGVDVVDLHDQRRPERDERVLERPAR